MKATTRKGREVEADVIVDRVRIALERHPGDGKKSIGIAVPWGTVATTRAKLRNAFPEHVVKVVVQR